jgi:hypothetical protein
LEWKRRNRLQRTNIRGTDIVDLLKYCVTPYHPDIPEPTGLSIFIKGLAELEIDKSLIVNGHLLSVLAHKWSRAQSDADATCNSCNKYIYISHLSTGLYAHGQIFIRIVKGVAV